VLERHEAKNELGLPLSRQLEAASLLTGRGPSAERGGSSGGRPAFSGRRQIWSRASCSVINSRMDVAPPLEVKNCPSPQQVWG